MYAVLTLLVCACMNIILACVKLEVHCIHLAAQGRSTFVKGWLQLTGNDGSVLVEG